MIHCQALQIKPARIVIYRVAEIQDMAPEARRTLLKLYATFWTSSVKRKIGYEMACVWLTGPEETEFAF